MNDERRITTHIGSWIDSIVRDQAIKPIRMCCEWLDNSLDAGATMFSVTIANGTLTVRDNGPNGCPDIEAMASLGGTVAHNPNARRSGRFGLGGTKAGIRASKGRVVKIKTVHNNMVYNLTVDWARAIEIGEVKAIIPPPTDRTRSDLLGTHIEIDNSMPFRNPQDIADELGYSYTDAIHNIGLKIILNIDGEKPRVLPYSTPDYSDRQDFTFGCRGHEITGYCVLVKSGLKNPYSGWSIHWGPWRVLGRYIEPADGKSTARLCGHVYLPDGWKDITVHKDGFPESPDDLFEMIGEHCRRIIDASHEESMSCDLNGVADAASILLEGMIAAGDSRIKGARPGTADKTGTAEPTEEGTEHQEFEISQPGPKEPKEPKEPNAPRAPKKCNIIFDPTMTPLPWKVEISGRKSRMAAVIYINPTHPHQAIFKSRNAAPYVAVYALALLAAHMAKKDASQYPLFPDIELTEIEEIYNTLTRWP